MFFGGRVDLLECRTFVAGSRFGESSGRLAVFETNLTIIDLHCHSTYSDGTLTPYQLVERAHQAGVAILALTDHDTTAGLDDGREAARAFGLTWIDGVEISVSWRERTLHVVGLQIDPFHPALAGGLAAIRCGRRARAERIVAALDALGVTGSGEGAREFAGNGEMIGRAHFARFLVARGTVRTVQGAFDRFLGPGRPGFVPHDWAELREAIHWIHAAGGQAVLAHPARYPLDNAEMRALLGEFRDLGGDALEVITGGATAREAARLAEHASSFGFAASVGSDYHGPVEHRYEPGNLCRLPKGCNPVWRNWELAGVRRGERCTDRLPT